MKNNKCLNLLAISALLITGCNDSNYRPTQVDNNFGSAYEQVTQAQILNRDAALNPPLNPPKNMDGQAGQATIQSYRDSFSTMQQSQSVEISSGGSGGGSSSNSNN